MSSETKSKAMVRRIQHPRLSEKEGALKRDEVQCPICWSILIQPVTMPCRHSLCLECFKRHVNETSLQCPCCRMRLSVWSRKAAKDNQLVDLKLWIRIQKEFPKLVEARLCGQDSQALEPLDLISMADREEPSDMINKNKVNEEDTEEELFRIENRIMDGVVSASKGDIKRELEAIVKQHQEDLENSRRQEEIASSELIKQMQDAGEVSQPVDPSIIEADLEAAKKLSQELEEDFRTKRLAKINANQPKSCVMQKQPKNANRIELEGWINNSQSAVKPLSGNSSCLNNLQTPKKRLSTSSVSSQSEKRPKNSINLTEASQSLESATRTRRKSSSKDKGEREVPNRLENSILTYLLPVSSNSAGSFAQTPIQIRLSDSEQQVSIEAGLNDVPQSHQTIVSKYLENKNDCNSGSAFSPNSSRPMIPRQIIYSSPLNQERFESATTKYLHTLSTNDDERDIPTPNSIDFELNTHFRPIESSPKTPPKRLSDGSYLPDPPIIKSLPARISIPPNSQLCDSDSLSNNTRSLETADESVNNVDKQTSPINSLDPVIISPEELGALPITSSAQRALTSTSTAHINSVKVKKELADFLTKSTPETLHGCSIAIKQEVLYEYLNEECPDLLEVRIDDQEVHEALLHIEVKKEVVSSQPPPPPTNPIVIDPSCILGVCTRNQRSRKAKAPPKATKNSKLEMEKAKALKKAQQVAKQLEKDRKLAERIQKLFDQGKEVMPPRSYSLRTRRPATQY